MISTWLPARVQSARSRATAFSSVPGGGVRMHQRPWNSSAKPASGPECSVPATGWPGTRWTPSGMFGPRSRMTACLTERTRRGAGLRLAADGDAQAMGQAVAAHLAHDQAAGLEEDIGRIRIGEFDQQEIADAGMDPIAGGGQRLGQPVAPDPVMRPALF